MLTYFTFGSEEATYDCKDDETAVALAKRIVKEIAFWDFKQGTVLQVHNGRGALIFEQPLRQALH